MKQRAKLRTGGALIAAPRSAYARPTLSVYGSVSRLTRGFGGTQVDFFMINNIMMASDRTLKENIVRIGTHPSGIGLYLFDFKADFRDRWGQGRQFGVMANEVEAVMPQAVSVDSDGRKMVNYAMLGIRIAHREPERET